MHRTLIVDAGKGENEAGCAAVWGVVDEGVSGHVFWVLCEAAASAAADGRVRVGADVRDLVTGRHACCSSGSGASPAVQQAEAALKPQSAARVGGGGGGNNGSSEGCEESAGAAAAPRSSAAVELVARGVVAVDPFANGGGGGGGKSRRGTAAATPFTFTVRGVAPGTAYTLFATLSRASAATLRGGGGPPRSRRRHRPAGDDNGGGGGVSCLALATAEFRTESSGACVERLRFLRFERAAAEPSQHDDDDDGCEARDDNGARSPSQQQAQPSPASLPTLHFACDPASAGPAAFAVFRGDASARLQHVGRLRAVLFPEEGKGTGEEEGGGLRAALLTGGEMRLAAGETRLSLPTARALRSGRPYTLAMQGGRGGGREEAVATCVFSKGDPPSLSAVLFHACVLPPVVVVSAASSPLVLEKPLRRFGVTGVASRAGCVFYAVVRAASAVLWSADGAGFVDVVRRVVGGGGGGGAGFLGSSSFTYVMGSGGGDVAAAGMFFLGGGGGGGCEDGPQRAAEGCGGVATTDDYGHGQEEEEEEEEGENEVEAILSGRILPYLLGGSSDGGTRPVFRARRGGADGGGGGATDTRRRTPGFAFCIAGLPVPEGYAVVFAPATAAAAAAAATGGASAATAAAAAPLHRFVPGGAHASYAPRVGSAQAGWAGGGGGGGIVSELMVTVSVRAGASGFCPPSALHVAGVPATQGLREGNGQVTAAVVAAPSELRRRFVGALSAPVVVGCGGPQQQQQRVRVRLRGAVAGVRYLIFACAVPAGQGALQEGNCGLGCFEPLLPLCEVEVPAAAAATGTPSRRRAAAGPAVDSWNGSQRRPRRRSGAAAAATADPTAAAAAAAAAARRQVEAAAAQKNPGAAGAVAWRVAGGCRTAPVPRLRSVWEGGEEVSDAVAAATATAGGGGRRVLDAASAAAAVSGLPSRRLASEEHALELKRLFTAAACGGGGGGSNAQQATSAAPPLLLACAECAPQAGAAAPPLPPPRAVAVAKDLRALRAWFYPVYAEGLACTNRHRTERGWAPLAAVPAADLHGWLDLLGTGEAVARSPWAVSWPAFLLLCTLSAEDLPMLRRVCWLYGARVLRRAEAAAAGGTTTTTTTTSSVASSAHASPNKTSSAHPPNACDRKFVDGDGGGGGGKTCVLTSDELQAAVDEMRAEVVAWCAARLGRAGAAQAAGAGAGAALRRGPGGARGFAAGLGRGDFYRATECSAADCAVCAFFAAADTVALLRARGVGGALATNCRAHHTCGTTWGLTAVQRRARAAAKAKARESAAAGETGHGARCRLRGFGFSTFGSAAAAAATTTTTASGGGGGGGRGAAAAEEEEEEALFEKCKKATLEDNVREVPLREPDTKAEELLGAYHTSLRGCFATSTARAHSVIQGCHAPQGLA